MKKVEVDCPHCQDNIVKSSGDEVKMRAKILKWNRHGMYAICKSCGTDVPISTDLMRAIQSSFVFEVPPDKIIS